MKPDKPGIWEWFDYKGVKKLVEVYDVNVPGRKSWLRVAFAGGYYNVNDESLNLVNTSGQIVGNYTFSAEWPDRWGERVGKNGSLPEDQLYLFPDRS